MVIEEFVFFEVRAEIRLVAVFCGVYFVLVVDGTVFFIGFVELCGCAVCVCFCDVVVVDQGVGAKVVVICRVLVIGIRVGDAVFVD